MYFLFLKNKFKHFKICNYFNMSKYKIVNLFDKVFVTVAVFLVVYAWINFFIRDLITTFFLSLIFSFAIVFLIFYIYNRKKEKSSNTKKYIKDVDEKFLAFRLMNKTNQLCFLNKILQIHFPSKILTDTIVFKKEEKTHLIIIATDIERINEFNLINLLQGRKKVEVIEIICNDFDTNLNTKILCDTEIVFTTKKKLYDEYFFKHSTYPDCSNLNTKINAINIKQILKNFIMPTKAKSYFLCGLILIFSSLILPFHTYYLTFGSILLILSIICKLQPHFKR